MKYDKTSIGRRILKCRREYRDQDGYRTKCPNQEDFGFLLKDDPDKGYRRQDVSDWEKGKKLPPIEAMIKMCDLFDCELGYLLCEYNTKERTATDIHKETGLSEEAIGILKDEYIDEEHSEPLGIDNRSTKIKIIDKFIRECDHITKSIDIIKIPYHADTGLEFHGINSNYLKTAFVQALEEHTEAHDKWIAFRDAFIREYPDTFPDPYNDNYIMNIYQTFVMSFNGSEEAERFSIDREFNRIIDEYLRQDQTRLNSGESASEDK